MLVLGIDTGSETCAVGLAAGDRIIGETNLKAGRTHSRLLVPAVGALLSQAGFQPGDVDAVAVSSGPGSFTGLRIGVVTAKTLSWALGAVLVGVSSLDVLAANAAGFPGSVAVVLDARRERVYSALYGPPDPQGERRDAGATHEGASGVLGRPKLFTDGIRTPMEMVELLSGMAGPVLVIGNGRSVCYEAFTLTGLAIITAEPADDAPRGALVARLGFAVLGSGVGDDPLAMAPRYFRESPVGPGAGTPVRWDDG